MNTLDVFSWENTLINMKKKEKRKKERKKKAHKNENIENEDSGFNYLNCMKIWVASQTFHFVPFLNGTRATNYKHISFGVSSLG